MSNFFFIYQTFNKHLSGVNKYTEYMQKHIVRDKEGSKELYCFSQVSKENTANIKYPSLFLLHFTA